MKRLFAPALVALFAAYGAVQQSSGVEEPTPLQVEALRDLAEQGDPTEQFNLGNLYYHGEGVAEDYAEAVKWYRMAAEQGEAKAQYNLGYMYNNGKGVPQDYLRAYKWFNLAASRASGQDAEKYRKGRDALVELMTPDQIAEAQQLAREWKPKTWEELKGQAADQ